MWLCTCEYVCLNDIGAAAPNSPIALTSSHHSAWLCSAFFVTSSMFYTFSVTVWTLLFTFYIIACTQKPVRTTKNQNLFYHALKISHLHYIQVKYSFASQVALVVKNLPASAGDTRDEGLIPGWGRSPGGGNSNPLQYSCLENPMDKGTWWATVHSVTKSQTWPKRLIVHTRTHSRTHTHTHTHAQRLTTSPASLYQSG